MPFQEPQRPDELEGGTADDDGDEGVSIFAEINITPLTDVILVLLIIFMVSTSAMVDAVRSGHLDVTLPTASGASEKSPDLDPIVVRILADGRVLVEERVVNEDELLAYVADSTKKKPGSMVLMQADGDLQHKTVVHVIDVLRRSGVSTVGIETTTEAAPQ